MAEPKAKTLQQRFGFADSDLKSPKHDEIMLWLDANAEALIRKHFRPAAGWNAEYVKSCQQQWDNFVASHKAEIRGNVDDWQGLGDPPWQPLEVTAKKWELPIQDRTYIIGFIDLAIKYRISHNLTVITRDFDWEIHRLPEWDHNIEKGTFYFEVKTAIPSLGELIRQINMYRAYYTNGTYVVICPDDKYQEALKSQDIEFIKYHPQ